MSLLLEAINDQEDLPPITSCYGDALQIVKFSAESLEKIMRDQTIDSQVELYHVRTVVRTTIKALAHWAKLSDIELRNMTIDQGNIKDIVYEEVDKI